MTELELTELMPYVEACEENLDANSEHINAIIERENETRYALAKYIKDNGLSTASLGAMMFANENGYMSALQVLTELRTAKSIIEDMEKQLSDKALSEAHGIEGAVINGYTVGIRDSGRWKYNHIPEWQAMLDNEKHWANKRKQIEEDAQIASKLNKSGLADVGTGEVILPAYKEPNYTLILTKCKQK